eukprot:g10663.t1
MKEKQEWLDAFKIVLGLAPPEDDDEEDTPSEAPPAPENGGGERKYLRTGGTGTPPTRAGAKATLTTKTSASSGSKEGEVVVATSAQGSTRSGKSAGSHLLRARAGMQDVESLNSFTATEFRAIYPDFPVRARHDEYNHNIFPIQVPRNLLPVPISCEIGLSTVISRGKFLENWAEYIFIQISWGIGG